MNKKLLTVTGTVLVGGVLLAATAYAAVSGNTGYDAYKSALKNTIALKSATPTSTLTIKDNGNVIENAKSTIKVNKTARTMSAEVSLNDGSLEKTFEVYKTGEKTILKSSDSDVYNVLENKRMFNKEDVFKRGQKANARIKQKDPAKKQDLENVFDAFAGTLDNYTALTTNTDGSKEVTFKMSENQVSPVLNAVASLVVKNIDREKMHKTNAPLGLDQEVAALKDKLPKLVSDIKINDVDIVATINTDNYIQNQAENITLTGKDANGAEHQVTITLNTNLTGYNNTTPDTVDLTGKQVKEIKAPQGPQGRFERRK